MEAKIHFSMEANSISMRRHFLLLAWRISTDASVEIVVSVIRGSLSPKLDSMGYFLKHSNANFRESPNGSCTTYRGQELHSRSRLLLLLLLLLTRLLFYYYQYIFLLLLLLLWRFCRSLSALQYFQEQRLIFLKGYFQAERSTKNALE